MDKVRRTRRYQPVLTDIRKIAPTGWYGDPAPATVDRGVAMMDKIADTIAEEAGELFVQLEKALGGTAEVNRSREAV